MSKSASGVESEKVLVSGADKRDDLIYHTDPECDHAPNNGSWFTLATLPSGWRECRFCAGEFDACRNPDFSIYQAAKAYGENND